MPHMVVRMPFRHAKYHGQGRLLAIECLNLAFSRGC